MAVSCVLASLVVSQLGCSLARYPSNRVSLGDWMRGNHKPLTPDESASYRPPTITSVTGNLETAAVQMDGSLPPTFQSNPRYEQLDPGVVEPGQYSQAAANVRQVQYTQAAEPNRHVVRQYPSDGSAYGQANTYGQTNTYGQAPVAQAPVAQYPVTQYPANGVPAAGGMNPAYPNQAYPNQAYPSQDLSAPVIQNPVIQNPVIQNQPNPYAGQNPGAVEYQPNMTPFNPNNVQPQYAPQQRRQTQPNRSSFAPGTGAEYPPLGYEPIYTPTLRDADLIINGYPARTGRIMFGGAVNSDAGVTGQITVDEKNFDIRRWPRSCQELFTGQAFRGAGETFRIEAAPGSDFDRYTVSWATPNLFNYLPFSFSVSGFLFDRRFDDWDEQRKGGRTSLGYRITPDLSLTVGFSGQEVKITNPSSSLSPKLNSALGRNDLYTGSISLKHDTRNSPIQASSGHYLEFSFEEAFGDFDYSRFEVEFRQYWLLNERIDRTGKQTLSYSTKLGFSGDETPVFENFFAGGYATLRGFEFRGASPLENGVEVGGRFQWLNSLEYMFPLTADDAFRGVAFVDFGTVESNIKMHSDNFRVAPGVGFRVAIPALGPAPLAFDFAFPVAKADTDNERMFSFYMSLIR